MKMNAVVLVKRSALKRLKAAQATAFSRAAEDVVADLRVSETMPYRTGALDASTQAAAVNRDLARVQVATRAPYAAHMYGWKGNFGRRYNANAGGAWFAPYVNGGKVGLWAERFKARLRGLLNRRA